MMIAILTLLTLGVVASEQEATYGGRPTGDWIKQLESQDRQLRHEATNALNNIGPRALSQLITLLDHANADIRFAAASIIGRVGPRSGAAAPSLMKCLKDDSSAVRLAAADALGQIGGEAAVAEPALREATKDADSQVRRAAVNSLGNVSTGNEETVALLITMLGDSSDLLPAAAAQSLGRFGRRAKSGVPALAAVFADRERDVVTRSKAARALGAIGPGARSAVPVLIQVLRDKNAPYRASMAGGTTEVIRPDQTPLEIRALTDVAARWPIHRAYAALALVKIDPVSNEVAAALIDAIKDRSDIAACKPAAQALAWLGPLARPAVQYLVQELQAVDEQRRGAAADLLAEIGSAARSAAPALLIAMREAENPERFAIALETIGRADPDAIVPLLVESLKDANPRVRSSAASVLGELGPFARPALASLRQVVEDGDFLVRRSADWAIGQIDFANPTADPPIETLHFLRPSGDRFVPETTIHFRDGERGRFVVSHTDRGTEQLDVVARFDSASQLVDAVVTTQSGSKRQTASATADSRTVRITQADGFTRELDSPPGVIVTSAPDWTDAVLLVRRYDRDAGGRQEFSGLWMHPTQEPLRVRLAIERIGESQVRHEGDEVKLDRFVIELRGGSRYVVWGDTGGRLVRLVNEGRSNGGIVLLGWQDTAWLSRE